MGCRRRRVGSSETVAAPLPVGEGRMMAGSIVNENVRYEPDENPPPLVALGAGAQAAMLIVAPMSC